MRAWKVGAWTLAWRLIHQTRTWWVTWCGALSYHFEIVSIDMLNQCQLSTSCSNLLLEVVSTQDARCTYDSLPSSWCFDWSCFCGSTNPSSCSSRNSCSKWGSCSEWYPIRRSSKAREAEENPKACEGWASKPFRKGEGPWEADLDEEGRVR